MKKKFSKILGVGLTLALLCSLLLTAAPVLASSVSQPTVALDEEEISVAEEYVITFVLGEQLYDPVGTDASTITIRFPDDTFVPDDSALDINTDFTVSASPGWIEGNWETPVAAAFSGITAASTEDDRTVVFTLPDAHTNTDQGLGEGATVRIKLLKAAGIKNPSDPGTYTLEVKTSEETDYVPSEEYDIGIPPLPGGIYVKNAAGIQVGFETNLYAAVDSVTAADFTITVGPGTYDITTGPLLLNDEGVTLESSAGADETIIVALASNNVIEISVADVTVDGFTIDDTDSGQIAIKVSGVDATVINNIFTADDGWPEGIRIETSGTGATVSGNELDIAHTMIVTNATDATLSDNIFGAGINVDGSTEIDITGNDLTGAEFVGIRFGSGTSDDILIEDNIISEVIDGEGAGIRILSGVTVTNLKILNNEIIDNEEVGILIEGVWGDGNVIKFNTITGPDDGIKTDEVVDASFNWWGTTIADDIGDMVSDDVNYEPFLTNTAEAAIAGGKAVTNASSLDAKDEAGVKVTGVVEDATPFRVADVISAVKFAANPVDALGGAIAFYDVYVVLEADFVTADVTAKVKFYDSAITTGSTAHFWTGDFWALCSDMEARDGIIYVTITDETLPALDELEETIFGVVAGEAVTEFGAPELLAPEVGADDVSLTPTFAWGAVTGAIGYDFEMADNTLFVIPMVSLTGELGRLIVTAYAYVGELPYSKAYYWRVKAVSADEESVWASGVFITMDEPVEPTPPIVIEPYEPPEIIIEQPDIIIKSPDVIVPLPDVVETPITPAWIYVIIGVGAVLVIALLVLIVRTRRVA